MEALKQQIADVNELEIAATEEITAEATEQNTEVDQVLREILNLVKGYVCIEEDHYYTPNGLAFDKNTGEIVGIGTV